MSQTKAQLISDLFQALNFTGTASAPANGLFLSAANTLQLSTASTPRLTIDSSGNLNIPNDTGKLKLGASQDLQLYHDSTHSYITNDTGTLRVRGDDIRLQNKNGETFIKNTSDSSVELYFDNSKKIETTSTGATVTGVLISDGLTLFDNEKILIGNNTDLEIFHNGTNTIIQSDTGDLQINSGNSAGDVVINVNNNVAADIRETSAKFIKNGSVELYHDNSKKFQTHPDGAEVVGHLLMGDSKEIKLGASSDLKIFHDGNSFITNTTATQFALQSDNLRLRSTTDNENYIVCTDEAGVEIYFDGSKKLETISTGVSVTGSLGIGTTSPDQLFHVETGGATSIRLSGNRGNSDNLHIANIEFENTFNSQGVIAEIRAMTGSSGTQSSQGQFAFYTDDGSSFTERIRIQANGDLLIGRTSVGNTGNGHSIRGGDSAVFSRDAIGETVQISRNSNDGSFVEFRSGDSGNASILATIAKSGSSVVYNTSSDYRLKENAVAISDGITRLKTLKPYRFNFKADASKTIDGFFAHEVTSSVPEAITGTKDAVDKDGNIDPQQIDQSKLVPLLVAAVQELTAKVEALEAA